MFGILVGGEYLGIIEVGSSGSIDVIACVAPVETGHVNLVGKFSNTATGSRQEDCTISFHASPISIRITVDFPSSIGRSRSTRSELETSRQRPIIGEDNQTRDTIDSTNTTLFSSVSTAQEEIAEFINTEKSPSTSLVTAISNLIVLTPIIVGSVDTSIITETILGVVDVGHVREFAIETAGTPTKEVNSGVSVGVGIRGSKIVILMLGELPSTGSTNILKVTFCKIDLLACTDGEKTINSTSGNVTRLSGNEVERVLTQRNLRNLATIDIQANEVVIGVLGANTTILSSNGDSQRGVGIVGEVHVEIVTIGDVLSGSADQRSGVGAIRNEVDGGSITIHNDGELTVDGSIGGNVNARNANTILLKREFQSTAEVFERKILIIGDSIHGEASQRTIHGVLNSGEINCGGSNCNASGEDCRIRSITSVTAHESESSGSGFSCRLGTVDGATSGTINGNLIASDPFDTFTIQNSLAILESARLLNSIELSNALILLARSHCQGETHKGEKGNKSSFHFFCVFF